MAANGMRFLLISACIPWRFHPRKRWRCARRPARQRAGWGALPRRCRRTGQGDCSDTARRCSPTFWDSFPARRPPDGACGRRRGQTRCGGCCNRRPRWCTSNL